MSSGSMRYLSTISQTSTPSSPHKYGKPSAKFWAQLPASPQNITLKLTATWNRLINTWSLLQTVSPYTNHLPGAPTSLKLNMLITSSSALPQVRPHLWLLWAINLPFSPFRRRRSLFPLPKPTYRDVARCGEQPEQHPLTRSVNHGWSSMSPCSCLPPRGKGMAVLLRPPSSNGVL